MVNEWVVRSIEVANRENYLDQLYEVYPLDFGEERLIPAGTIDAIQQAHNARDGVALVRELLRIERFPIGYPYATLLRQRLRLADLNPQTMQRIARHLLDMEFSRLLAHCMTPKPANTRIGPMFRNYVRDLGYPILERTAFDSSNGVAFLDGSDRTLKQYANAQLDCGLRKGLDLLFKTRRGYFIGEAKFFSSSGGNQNNKLDEALDFLGGHVGNAARIAVLDGTLWFDGINQKLQREIRQVDAVAVSALLVGDYIESVRS